MKGADIREQFLQYFESKGHTRVSSAALVPADDPTLLFTNAGMNQFKECFLGTEKRDYTRATTSQKCLRISGKHNDFENVGVTARHHTFFEMLGNFSFGDYFKTDAIRYGWEFVTDVLSFDKDRLWVTIFEDDDEAEALWREHTDIGPERILRMGEKDNFWAMGETGPCGPCSEIHYYLGATPDKQSEEEFRLDDGTYMEIWNLVFMQFNRDADGNLNPLPKPSVDTGMGLERVTAIAQGVKSNYDTDLLREVISVCEKLSGFTYDGSSYQERDLRSDVNYARDVAMRVIADHSRAAAFLIADGVNPGSDGRSYVLRRIIRRAIRHGQVLQFKKPFMVETVQRVIAGMGGQYPELVERNDLILRIIGAEESKFHETLDAGLAILQREVEKVPEGEQFPGEVAFLLHDTYGFPLDLTEDALKAFKMKVDTASFDKAMAAQKERSRDDRRSQNIVFSAVELSGAPTEFLGYTTTTAESKVTQIISEKEGGALSQGDRLSVVVSATPFYGESGGQVGDTGVITIADARLEVVDTQRSAQGHFIHQCRVSSGELAVSEVGATAALEVDELRRNRIRLNHSATHIVHAGLQRFLGEHVKQAGSRVDDGSLRFDYSHFEQVSQSQLDEIEDFVNEEVRKNYEIVTREMPVEEARAAGAKALFGEKYGDIVRVVQIGPNSMELCGGTHADRSGDIGMVVISSDGGISAGVRRIECWSGSSAHTRIMQERNERRAIAGLLKADTHNLPEKVERILQRTRELERELNDARGKIASQASGDLVERARVSPSGIKVITECIDGADTKTLKSMVDKLRVKLGSGVVALGSAQGPRATIVTGVTSDLTETVDAGSLVKEAARTGGGKGGGRSDFAQAGGVESSKLGAALDRVFQLVA